ncbi:MAG: acyltransferase [Comamonas sp.]
MHNNRNLWLDVIKGSCCAAIVWHHLAFYGPMSDVAAQVTPDIIGWLSEYARIAVQIFLVMGGYLAAASLAPQGQARFDRPLAKIGQRALRLLAPYAVALLFAVLIAALVRPWFEHDSVPAEPTWQQLIANALMLQDITGEDALSAGVWYVAIDFQLFAAVTLLFAVTRRWSQRWLGLSVGQYVVVGLTALSLWELNRESDLDMWFVYFIGAYGMGMLAYWGKSSAKPWVWTALLLVLGLVSFEVEFRLRIAVALTGAVALLWLMRVPSDGKVGNWLSCHVAPLRWLQLLGQMSYSVFLVHFSIVVLCNAVVSHIWPTQPWLNWLGMCTAFVLSLLAGRVLYRFVESQVPSLKGVARWELGFVGLGLLVSVLSTRFAM